MNIGNSKIIFYPNQTLATWEEIEKEPENVFSTTKIDPIEKSLIPYEKDINILNKVNLEESCLSENAKEKLKNIIFRNSKAFVGIENNVGFFSGPIKHDIDLIDESITIHNVHTGFHRVSKMKCIGKFMKC